MTAPAPQDATADLREAEAVADKIWDAVGYGARLTSLKHAVAVELAPLLADLDALRVRAETAEEDAKFAWDLAAKNQDAELRNYREARDAEARAEALTADLARAREEMIDRACEAADEIEYEITGQRGGGYYDFAKKLRAALANQGDGDKR